MVSSQGNGKPTLEVFLGRCIVLDTAGPIVYIGRLESFDERGYWLTQAELYDRNEGHSTKERYVSEAYHLERSGTRPANRRRLFVERSAIISISALEDVIADLTGDNPTGWMA